MQEPSTLSVVLIGFATVFVILISIILIIILMSMIIRAIQKEDGANATPQPVLASTQASPPASAAGPAGQSAANRPAVVAAMAVAIAEDMGTDVSHLRIHSIRGGAAASGPASQAMVVSAMAAAIAEDMGTDVSHLRIHSIRRI